MSTTVIVPDRSVNLLLRIIYFVVFGLWFSGIWAAVAWVLCITIIGLPLGLWMLNRLPLVTTLKAQPSDLVIHNGRVYERAAAQQPFILRALYFFVIGWWFSALWMVGAWALSTTIIGLPLGFWMFNRVPLVITLAR